MRFAAACQRVDKGELMADANLQDRDAVRDVVMVDKVTRRTLNHGDHTSLHEVTIKKGG